MSATTPNYTASVILTRASENTQSPGMTQGYRRPSTSGLIFTPFRMALVFTGRSTRTELLGWWLLGGLFFGLVGALADVLISAIAIAPEGETWFIQALNLVMGFVSLALLVRRLHDIGHSGWWLALLAGMLAASLIGMHYYAAAHPDAGVETRFLSVHFHPGIAWTATLATLVVIDILALLGIFALILVPGTIGANRFGPDPRTAPDPTSSQDASAL